MPPFIPFPSVPAYPGVPLLARPSGAAIAAVPQLVIAIGSVQNILASSIQQPVQWGIFDQSGQQLGIQSDGSASIVQAALSQVIGGSQTVLSTVSFDFNKETRVSTFPSETGGFANYNKVENPANPTVTLALDGTESDRNYFINSINAACTSTELYSVVTPEITLVNYTIEHYSYRRSAQRGATLLIVEVSLLEVRSVSATFTQASTPINAPVDPNATPAVDNGKVQTSSPDTSTLKSITNAFPSLGGGS